ncbi:MAG: hypothetical protein ACMUJM_02275 [bacterium]
MDGNCVGTVEVYYMEEKPEMDEGPFLKEERDLINTIAAKIARIVKSQITEEALKDSQLKLQEQKERLE